MVICSDIVLKEISLEIGFIEAMRTTLEVIKRCRKAFFHTSLHSRKYGIIRSKMTGSAKNSQYKAQSHYNRKHSFIAYVLRLYLSRYQISFDNEISTISKRKQKNNVFSCIGSVLFTV